MDEKIKRKWIKALRSGEYEQGKGNYYKHEKYCCLGVLVCVLTGERGMDAVNEATRNYPDLLDRTLSDLLDRTLSDWDQNELAKLNDSGATFEQIALCIENGL